MLLSISPDIIKKKQAALEKLAPRVQYAIPPLSNLLDRHDSSVWEPPFPDGVDIALDGFFERTENVMKNRSTHIPHRFMTRREWDDEYSIVKIQIPRSDGILKFGAEANANSSRISVALSRASLTDGLDSLGTFTDAGSKVPPNGGKTMRTSGNPKGKHHHRIAPGHSNVKHGHSKHGLPSMGAPGEEDGQAPASV